MFYYYNQLFNRFTALYRLFLTEWSYYIGQIVHINILHNKNKGFLKKLNIKSFILKDAEYFLKQLINSQFNNLCINI
jgi:hypothetical protein